MAKKARAKKISVAEFKSWISGIEEMQSDDWYPSAEQWAKIREKIELIEEAKPVKSTEQSVPAPVQQVPRVEMPAQHTYGPLPPLPPMPSGGIPDDVVIENNPSIGTQLPPRNTNAGAPSSITAPDITAAERGKSSFE